MNDFEEKMKTTKHTLIVDKDFVKVRKDTFESMNNVIEETKKIKELQPKLEHVFNEVDNYATSYKTLEKENQKYKNEVNRLENENDKLKEENRSLKNYIEAILMAIKKFFRKVLQLGNEDVKEVATSEIKDYYDNDDFDKKDVKDISVATTKQDELFEYADIPDYYKERVRDKDECVNNDYEMER